MTPTPGAPGERALTKLLTTLSPRLDSTPYIYMHLPQSTPLPPPIAASLTAPPAPDSPALAAFFEPHRAAWTLVLPAHLANAVFPADYTNPASANEGSAGSVDDAGIAATRASFWPCRLVTLDVHSSLEGVGFMAAVSAALAGAGVGCNPLAGWYSDHLFVAEADAGRAVGVLHGVRERALRGEGMA